MLFPFIDQHISLSSKSIWIEEFTMFVNVANYSLTPLKQTRFYSERNLLTMDANSFSHQAVFFHLLLYSKQIQFVSPLKSVGVGYNCTAFRELQRRLFLF